MSDVTVINNADRSRYEARIDNELAGRLEYQLSSDRITFTHTVVEDEFQGKGVAGTLVKAALADVRQEGTRKVVPVCSYVHHYLEKHPDEAEIAAE